MGARKGEKERENGIERREKECKVPCKRPLPLKHKFLRKVGGGRLLGILPFVQSIIQPLKVQVNTKRLEFKQKSYLFQLKRKAKESW